MTAQRIGRRLGLGAVAVAIALLGHALLAQQQAPRDLFERARMIDEINDTNLPDAIRLYEQVAGRTAENPTLAAEAQLRAGMLYERLGRKSEAQRAFEAVVTHHASQGAAVSQARARLTSALTERVAMTTTGVGVVLYSVTPDGRFGAGSDESNGDLIVRDMASGRVTRLLNGTLDPRTGVGGARVSFAALSPDHRQMAFTRHGESGNTDRASLWVMSNQPGGTPRLLVSKPEFRDMRPMAWFPDGRSLFVWILRADKPRQVDLARISIADGAVRVFKTVDPDPGPFVAIDLPRLSPDGRYVTYSRSTRADKVGDWSIFILEVDGSGRDVAVTQSAGVNDVPVWTPDGRHILFISNRTGNFDLWAVPVRNGQADGSPVMLKRNIGSFPGPSITSIGMTQAGSYYYRPQGSGSALDSITVARASGNSWTVDNTIDITGVAPTWSPDGKMMAFLKRRETLNGGQFMVMIKSLDTGEERVVARDQGFAGTPPQWSPDGKSLLATATATVAAPITVLKRLARIDASGQTLTTLLHTFDLRFVDWTFAPDGQSVYFLGRTPKAGRFANESTYCVMKLDLDTQRIEEVAPLPKDSVEPNQPDRIRTSPDGRSLVFTARNDTRVRFLTVSVSGGSPKEVFSDVSVAAGQSVTWTRDSKALLIGKRENANRFQIVRLDLESGATQTMMVIDSAPGNIELSPDGSRLAFVTRVPLAETKVLDNVLSALK